MAADRAPIPLIALALVAGNAASATPLPCSNTTLNGTYLYGESGREAYDGQGGRAARWLIAVRGFDCSKQQGVETKLLRQRCFWQVADAELIAAGATEPSASLFIGEQQIPLERDGTFRVQVPFKDGEQERSIRMEFQRSTPQARVTSRAEAQLVWF